jgi:hypothetical protein
MNDPASVPTAVQPLHLHDELQQRLDQLGWLPARLNREARLSKDYIGQCLRKHTYPQRGQLERIIAALGLPEEQAARWRTERTAARAYRTDPPEKCPAPRCGREFIPGNSKQKYCSARCRGRARLVPNEATIDNRLKKDFLRVLDDRRLTVDQAARELSARRTTWGRWLNTKGQQLMTPQLQALAPWLGITVAEAARRQGGTGEAHRVEVTIARNKAGDFQAAFWQDEKYADQQERVRKSRRGKQNSESHRAKISAGLRAYRQQPGAHDILAHTQGLLHRARRLLANYKHFHSDWTAAKCAEQAVERLMLLGGPLIDEATAQLAVQAAMRPRKPKRRHGGGRPSEWQRCQLVRRLTTAGQQTKEIARAVAQSEGIHLDDHDDERRYRENFKRWRRGHRHVPACFKSETREETTLARGS